MPSSAEAGDLIHASITLIDARSTSTSSPRQLTDGPGTLIAVLSDLIRAKITLIHARRMLTSPPGQLIEAPSKPNEPLTLAHE